MASVDVTVFGAGIFGLSCAWACVRRGARVQVVDPGGVAAGSSGGIVGALAPHVPENWNAKKAFQLDSLLMAQDWWAEVQASGGLDAGYARTGRLQPIADDHAAQLARAREQGAIDLWQGQAVWRVVPRPSGPLVPRSPSGQLIHDTLSARIHPRQACKALAAALAANGCDILPEAPLRGAALWATGWTGLQQMSQSHHRMVGAGVKGQAALLRFDAADAPQVFVDGLHVVPHADGTVAIGSTSERDFAEPSTIDAQCDGLIDRARAALPELEQAEVLERWAGVRPRSRSRAPMLGGWPGREGHFIANGGFKIGFGMAPKVAGVMAELILNQKDQIPQGFRVEDNL